MFQPGDPRARMLSHDSVKRSRGVSGDKGGNQNKAMIIPDSAYTNL